MRIIRLYTPKFQALIDTYVNQGLDALHTSIEGVEEIKEEINEPLVKHSVITILEAFWFHGGDLPEWLGLPEALQTPEFVTYNLDEDEIGQPLIPSILPDNFIIQPLTISKLQYLKNWIDDEVPVVEPIGTFDGSDALPSDNYNYPGNSEQHF